MLKTLLKKCFLLCITLLLIVTCIGCKEERYLIKDYLNDLAFESGLSETKEINESFNSLYKWEVIDKMDQDILNKELKYDYLSKTICRLINVKEDIDYLKDIGLIEKSKKIEDKVLKDEAISIIQEAIKIINNQSFENNYSYELKDNIDIEDIDLNSDNFKDIFKSYEMSGEHEINFDEAEIEYYGTEEETSYINNTYELLATKTKVFRKNGYRISYSFNTTGLSARISKNESGGLNTYFDITLTNIKPTYKWKYKDDEVNSAYFKVKYNSTEKLGVSTGKYKNLYADFKDADKTNVATYLSTLLNSKADKLETSFVLCTVKTPIPNVPVANICIDVVVNLYVSGKAEIALVNNNEIGFEIKNGQTRFIKDVNRDADFVIKGSTKASAGINVSLQTSKLRLMDIQADYGIKAEVASILHIYDSDFNEASLETDESYSALEEVLEGNDKVKLCGDVSLRWLLDIRLNTAKTLLYKYGFSYSKEFLDDDAQVFGNLHHIENGHFVKKCTRKSKPKYKTKKADAKTSIMTLNKYSIVLKKNATYVIEPSLPEGYLLSDLRFDVFDPEVLSINKNTIKALKSGNSKIRIYTSDNAYEVYLNVLVSYEWNLCNYWRLWRFKAFKA